MFLVNRLRKKSVDNESSVDLTNKGVFGAKHKPPFQSPAWWWGNQFPSNYWAYLLLPRPCGFNFPHMCLLSARAEIPKDYFLNKRRFITFNWKGICYSRIVCVSAGRWWFWRWTRRLLSGFKQLFLLSWFSSCHRSSILTSRVQGKKEHWRSEVRLQGNTYTYCLGPWQPQPSQSTMQKGWPCVSVCGLLLLQSLVKE